MEKAFVINDMKSFECSSPSELDRKFFGEQSLPSALLLQQLSTSQGTNDVADGSDTRPSLLASLCLSSDPISPSPAFSVHNLNTQEADACHLAVPLQGKEGTSSTPLLLGTRMKSAGFYRLYGDLTASQMSWDISLIKSENSPKPSLESSALEATWSPKPQSTLQSQAEVSP